MAGQPHQLARKLKANDAMQYLASINDIAMSSQWPSAIWRNLIQLEQPANHLAETDL